MNKKLTVTIGIPAFNEEVNIKNILESIIKQKEETYSLEKIVVICDGSEDATPKIAGGMTLTDKRIVVLNDRKRKGKLKRLEQIYQYNKSDIIIVFDADVVLANEMVCENIVKKFSDPKVNLVGGNGVLVPSTTLFGKIIFSWTGIWHKAKLYYKNGNNLYNSKGCALALRKIFAKKISFPPGIISDSQYLYFLALYIKSKFVFSKESIVYYRKPDNYKDYLVQSQRASSEVTKLVEMFGNQVKEEYKIPLKYKIKALFLSLLKNPVFTILGGLFFIYSSIILPKLGYSDSGVKWQRVGSTKKGINIEDIQKNRAKPLLKISRIISLVAFILLIFVIKGDKGSPLYYQNEKDTKVGGPYELSNSSSRYALTEMIVKYKTFFFTKEEARFAAPDVVDYKGTFFSIFAPGVSFIGIPFYFVGNIFGVPQLMTYLSITLIAILNILLISKMAGKTGAGKYSSIIAGLVFVFATNGLSYSQTFTQHHLSTALILLALYNATLNRNMTNNIIFGLISGYALVVDVPNLILITPIGLYIVYKHLNIFSQKEKISISLKTNFLAILIGLFPIIMILGFYNYSTTGSYSKLAQNIGRTHYFREQLPIQDPADMVGEEKVTPLSKVLKRPLDLPFDTRSQLNGLYILLLSDERSWLYYSPIVLFGLIGFYLINKDKSKKELVALILSVVILNIILYSMFGDPWGGWSFGPRYLIPANALICIGLGYLLTKLNKNILFGLIFGTLLIYSIYVNSLGAMTTEALPPKVEAQNLSTNIPYTYKYNQKKIIKNESSSLIYNVYLKNKISLSSYTYTFITLVSLMFGVLYYKSIKQGEK